MGSHSVIVKTLPSINESAKKKKGLDWFTPLQSPSTAVQTC